MAARYGYMIYTFRVHPHGKEPVELGNFEEGKDSLSYMYGILNSLKSRTIKEKDRHIRATAVKGVGRTIRFSVEVGQSGQSSVFYEENDDDEPVFERRNGHIEANARRGLIVAPSRAKTGLLILEVFGRHGAKSLLAPLLSKAFRMHTGYILDVASVVDEIALEKFVAEARAHELTLRKSGLPDDIADAVEIARPEARHGQLELRIKPGRIRQFQRSLVSKLRGDTNTRNRLLTLHGLEFDELSVGMMSGERQTTLTVTADRVPTFVYELNVAERPSDDEFFAEVLTAVRDVGAAVGAVVTPGWDDGEWSEESQKLQLPLPEEEGPDHDSAPQ